MAGMNIIKYLCLIFFTSELVNQNLRSTLRVRAPSYCTVARWCAKFKRGRTSKNENFRTRCPISVMIEQMIKKVDNIVLADRRLIVCFIVEENKNSIGSFHNIQHNHLDVKKVSAHWVPGILSEVQ